MSKSPTSSADELISAIAELILQYKQPISATEILPTEEITHQLVIDALPSAPWTGLTGTGPATNMTPSAELDGKMKWLVDNLPGGVSKRQLVLDATEKYVNELLAKYYKP